ncbi:hypothetical protein CBP36_10005 [Acidovorax carolinensis]|uniref:Bacteriophage T5 Orf172 DNA-binding domain-containing protein n=1 Tax=Acidovorax carolinensis TaxID=553814 RepID=A0A240UDE2_9BURK|nr:hypothetical protein CBP35_08920 [Acidovorax carolinensis]ART59136.1 hypothetical protein CBP36_10005 [Acidovorax carolinensis]
MVPQFHPSFVYIAFCSYKPWIKIGKADLPLRRLEEIGISGLISTLMAFKLPSSSLAYEMESALKSHLKQHRIDEKEVNFGCSGRTEWFEIAAIGLLDDFLKEHTVGRLAERIDPYTAEHLLLPGCDGGRPTNYPKSLSKSSLVRDKFRARSMLQALVDLERVSSEFAVSQSAGPEGYIQLRVETLNRPDMINALTLCLKHLSSQARCQTQRLKLIRRTITDNNCSFMLFEVAMSPAKETNYVYDLEALFSEPLEFLRSRIGDHKTASTTLRHRFKLHLDGATSRLNTPKESTRSLGPHKI